MRRNSIKAILLMSLFPRNLMKDTQRMNLLLRTLKTNGKRMISLRTQLFQLMMMSRRRRREEKKLKENIEGKGKKKRSPSGESMERSMVERERIEIKRRKSMEK